MPGEPGWVEVQETMLLRKFRITTNDGGQEAEAEGRQVFGCDMQRKIRSRQTQRASCQFCMLDIEIEKGNISMFGVIGARDWPQEGSAWLRSAKHYASG